MTAFGFLIIFGGVGGGGLLGRFSPNIANIDVRAHCYCHISLNVFKFYSLSSNGGSSIVSIPRKQCFVFREEISPILQVSLPSAVVHKAL